jgi:hypothetical protein
MIPTTTETMATTIDARSSQPGKLLRERMSKPQRHRLLHGFPLAAAMPFANEEVRSLSDAGDQRFAPVSDCDRELLVGVLPHSFCNPKIAGCGFCTFPHEDFSSLKAACGCQRSDSRDRCSHGIGSASEATIDPMVCILVEGPQTFLRPSRFEICVASSMRPLIFQQAEVTLEGVPAYFLNRKPLLLDILPQELAARHFRSAWACRRSQEPVWNKWADWPSVDLKCSPRLSTNAHARGMTASADFCSICPDSRCRK